MAHHPFGESLIWVVVVLLGIATALFLYRLYYRKIIFRENDGLEN